MEGDGGLSFRCNLCWELLQGSSWKASCNHVFCEECAFRHFSQRQDCPQCSRILGDDDFLDFIVGMDQANAEQAIYQEILHSPAWDEALRRCLKLMRTAESAVGFAFTQLVLSHQRNERKSGSCEEQFSAYKRDASKQLVALKSELAAAQQREKQASHRLTAKDREFQDLQNAYREKSRKCQAWEKAYSSLRVQRGDAGLVTPPAQSPRGPSSRPRLNLSSGSPLHARPAPPAEERQHQRRVAHVASRSPSPRYRRHGAQQYQGPVSQFRVSTGASADQRRFYGAQGSPRAPPAPPASPSFGRRERSSSRHFFSSASEFSSSAPPAEEVGSPLIRSSLGTPRQHRARPSPSREWGGSACGVAAGPGSLKRRFH